MVWLRRTCSLPRAVRMKQRLLRAGAGATGATVPRYAVPALTSGIAELQDAQGQRLAVRRAAVQGVGVRDDGDAGDRPGYGEQSRGRVHAVDALMSARRSGIREPQPFHGLAISKMRLDDLVDVAFVDVGVP